MEEGSPVVVMWSYPGAGFRPCDGVGVIAVLETSAYSTDADFACGGQATAGVCYRFSERLECSLACKPLVTGPTTLGEADVEAFLPHSVLASVGFNF